MKTLKRLINEESGQGLIEYVLLIAVIVAVCVAVVGSLNTSLSAKATEATDAIAAA